MRHRPVPAAERQNKQSRRKKADPRVGFTQLILISLRCGCRCGRCGSRFRSRHSHIHVRSRSSRNVYSNIRSRSRRYYRCLRSRHCCLRRRSNRGSFFFFTTSSHGNSQQSSQENGVFHLSSLYKQYKNPHQKSVRDFGNPTDAPNSNKTSRENQHLGVFPYTAANVLRHHNKKKRR